MQLFALFNILDICLAEEKLLSLPRELSCLCVCTTGGIGPMAEGPYEWVKKDLESVQIKTSKEKDSEVIFVLS